eukprot:10742777-Lingulodinium_polyedra.AAC.1
MWHAIARSARQPGAAPLSAIWGWVCPLASWGEVSLQRGVCCCVTVLVRGYAAVYGVAQSSANRREAV